MYDDLFALWENADARIPLITEDGRNTPGCGERGVIRVSLGKLQALNPPQPADHWVPTGDVLVHQLLTPNTPATYHEALESNLDRHHQVTPRPDVHSGAFDRSRLADTSREWAQLGDFPELRELRRMIGLGKDRGIVWHRTGNAHEDRSLIQQSDLGASRPKPFAYHRRVAAVAKPRRNRGP